MAICNLVNQCYDSGLEIKISRQWTIGPPALEIWWSCQISGGPDVAKCTFVLVKSNTADRIDLLPYETFEKDVVLHTGTF